MVPAIGQAYSDPPYHYDRNDSVTIVFRTDPSVIAAALPPVLKPAEKSDLASIRVVRPARSPFGPYVGTYLAVPALLDGKPVSHCLSGMKTTFSGTVAGREVWGMPLQVGEASVGWDGDVLNIVSGRNGVDFVRASVRLESRAEAPASAALLTYATRRQAFEENAHDNVLIGLKGGLVDPSEVSYWKASSVLKLVGGVPGDDWSMFPVHEVVETRYQSGGRSLLNRGTIVAQW